MTDAATASGLKASLTEYSAALQALAYMLKAAAQGIRSRPRRCELDIAKACHTCIMLQEQIYLLQPPSTKVVRRHLQADRSAWSPTSHDADILVTADTCVGT